MISNVCFGRQLPPPEKLFKLEKAGKYDVTVEMRCFVGPYCASRPTNMHLIRLPPVTLRVMKAEEK